MKEHYYYYCHYHYYYIIRDETNARDVLYNNTDG